MTIRIEDVTTDTIDDLINVCIPDEPVDPLLTEGINTKKIWAQKVLETYGSFAKLAYDETLAGMIQFLPDVDERIIEIQCIFVPQIKNHRRGVGTQLLKALMKDMKSPKPYFDHKKPEALVTYAFDVPGRYPQHKFYQKMGFTNVDDPYLMYYPLESGFKYTEKEFVPQEEDAGKVLIFYDPSCPFNASFREKIVESIKEITNIPVKIINTFENREEIKKRGNVPYCVVNKKPIESFVLDEEDFQQEVKKALQE